MNALERSDMKINQPTDNSLYVTIGNFTYYFDEKSYFSVQRWHKDDDDINEPELFQTTEDE